MVYPNKFVYCLNLTKMYLLQIYYVQLNSITKNINTLY